jgi:hypothetical protein
MKSLNMVLAVAIIIGVPGAAFSQAEPCQEPPAGFNVIEGDESDNLLIGTSGNDWIHGRNGNDLILGVEEMTFFVVVTGTIFSPAGLAMTSSAAAMNTTFS